MLTNLIPTDYFVCKCASDEASSNIIKTKFKIFTTNTGKNADISAACYSSNIFSNDVKNIVGNTSRKLSRNAINTQLTQQFSGNYRAESANSGALEIPQKLPLNPFKRLLNVRYSLATSIENNRIQNFTKIRT